MHIEQHTRSIFAELAETANLLVPEILGMLLYLLCIGTMVW